MKGLICSAAVASALLAVTAVPSGAVQCVMICWYSATFDKTYVFSTSRLPLTELIVRCRDLHRSF